MGNLFNGKSYYKNFMLNMVNNPVEMGAARGLVPYRGCCDTPYRRVPIGSGSAEAPW